MRITLRQFTTNMTHWRIHVYSHVFPWSTASISIATLAWIRLDKNRTRNELYLTITLFQVANRCISGTCRKLGRSRALGEIRADLGHSEKFGNWDKFRHADFVLTSNPNSDWSRGNTGIFSQVYSKRGTPRIDPIFSWIFIGYLASEEKIQSLTFMNLKTFTINPVLINTNVTHRYLKFMNF